MNRRTCIVGLVCVAWLMTIVARAGAADVAAERVRLASERSAIKARFNDRERECQARFAVTACVDEARREERASIAKLRKEQTTLDEAEQHQRAAERMQKIESRMKANEASSELASPGEFAASAPAAARPRARGEPRATRAARAEPTPSPRVLPSSESASAASAERGAVAAVNKATFEKRLQAAQAHREAVERRNADRLKSGRAAKPLESPAATTAN